jgi:hypothetical protein
MPEERFFYVFHLGCGDRPILVLIDQERTRGRYPGGPYLVKVTTKGGGRGFLLSEIKKDFERWSDNCLGVWVDNKKIILFDKKVE